MMLVIPALDIRGGRCVRLYQGSYEQETVYFEDPVKMAKLWRVSNAKFLHLVDLDAARGGLENNRLVIRDICQTLDIPIQLGGGIRTLDDIQAARDLGVYRVILGTAAAQNPDLVSEALARFQDSHVVVGIDARDGEVRIDGWREGSGIDAIDLALDMERRGCKRIIYTDIRRDGTLEGPNLEAYRSLGRHLHKVRITASGGVGNYQHLIDLNQLRDFHVDSVIVGRALYENRFPCQRFWCWHNKEAVDLDCFSTAPLREAEPVVP